MAAAGHPSGSYETPASPPAEALPACNDRQAAYCERTFACLTESQVAANRDRIGTSYEECLSLLQPPCETIAGVCPEGEKYDLSAAKSCPTDIQALDCSAFIALVTGNTPGPQSCLRICDIELAPGECAGNCNCTCSDGRAIIGLVGGACTCDEACSPARGSGTCY
jgi:hypothetical protein